MTSDEFFLKQTLKLAKKGLSWTNPNPLVGAVIVKKNYIIGQGFHHKVGYPHAEIEALNSVTENPKRATLYLNLEPCVHFDKRTPPCTGNIIKSGIKRIVCCTLDPNPKVKGKGLAALKKTGIETSIGLLENEAKELNEAFFTYQEKKRPFVAIKFAASLDGKLATNEGRSKWITNEKARKYARSLRGQYQAVLVGINTILMDNPNLGIREKRKKDPIRIILDSKLRIPLGAKVLRDQNVIVVTSQRANKQKKEYFEKMGFTILSFNDEYIKVPELLSKLKEKEIISILVEGGGQTLGSFVDNRIIDKVYAFQVPIIIGGKEAISIGGEGVQTIKEALHLKNISFKKFDDNLLTIGYPY